MAKMQKRNGKRNWEICYPLPKLLRAFLGTPALNRSLGTPDKAEAKRRYPLKLMEVEAEVYSLSVKHFPKEGTGDESLANLRSLVDAFSKADNFSSEDGEFTEKDHLRDAMLEWLEKRERGTSLSVNQFSEARVLVSDAMNNRHRISDLIDLWRADVAPKLSQSTITEYERAITRFSSWCRAENVTAFEEVTRTHVRDFVAEKYHGLLGKSVNTALGGLGGVWNHAYTLGWVDEELTTWRNHKYQSNIYVGTGEKRSNDEDALPFTFEDIPLVLNGIRPTGYADIFRLGLTVGGVRSGEATSLRPKHITLEPDGYWVSVPGTKSKNAPRRCPVARCFDPLMKTLLEEAHGDFLLALRPLKKDETEKSRNDYLNNKANDKRRILKSIPDNNRKGVHSTRRLYIEMLEGAGVSLSTAKLLVGHTRSDITFGKYSGGNLVDLRQSVESMKWPLDLVEAINSRALVN